MTSVALCTYNGQKYLGQQLSSILNQSVSIDEIIICDDCSFDETVEIIKSFQKQFPSIIKFYINEVSLGTVKNFEKAISLCTGEFVFLSDQDDIWAHNKVERILKEFEINPNLEAVFSDANLIDDSGKQLNQTLFDNFFFNKTIQQKWLKNQALTDLIYDRSRITGATVAIRKKLYTRSFPNTLDIKIWHDAYLGVNAAANNGLAWITEPLINYRIHQAQQVGVGNGTTVTNNKDKDGLKNHLQIFRSFYRDRLLIADYILEKYPHLQKESLKQEGLNWIKYCDLRLNMPKTIFSRIVIVLNNCKIYKQHSNSFIKSIIKDILIPCK